MEEFRGNARLFLQEEGAMQKLFLTIGEENTKLINNKQDFEGKYFLFDMWENKFFVQIKNPPFPPAYVLTGSPSLPIPRRKISTFPWCCEDASSWP